MRVYNKCVKRLFVCVIVCLPCFSVASWKDEACINIEQDGWCVSVSENYEQPYCVTSVLPNRGNEDIDNAKICVPPVFTNKISDIGSDIQTIDLIKTTPGIQLQPIGDNNHIVKGGEPSNYVKFNGELWRIIGIYGNQLKIIRTFSIPGRQYNGSVWVNISW